MIMRRHILRTPPRAYRHANAGYLLRNSRVRARFVTCCSRDSRNFFFFFCSFFADIGNVKRLERLGHVHAYVLSRFRRNCEEENFSVLARFDTICCVNLRSFARETRSFYEL
ncbi:hypothetical protein PUN28_012618 [Cardiocondyla obscurior]|uniref:Uncharacterized protein n=1 Tax=Cardiocondyla obscurior TaxID=286306 RepID=A0AAW2FGS2_9HYME